MKAILFPKYGSPKVLRLEEVEKPAPKDDQVLIKVRAASINSLDWHFMRGSPFLVRVSGSGIRRPKDPRLGVDLAGTVEAVGAKVTRLRVGDAVFGRGDGAFAEYACAREDALVAKPATMTFETAAAVPIAALTALEALRDRGGIQAGQQVLIYGASGGVGSFAVQLAKYFGAEVTAVCGPRSVEQARSLGADHVIDYTKEDFSKKGLRYDVILGVNGYRRVSAFRRALRHGGTYVMVGAANARLMRAMAQTMFAGAVMSRVSRKNARTFMAKPRRADLELVRDLIVAGKVTPVIDACYPLADTVEAMRYFEEVHPRGKVVITVDHNRP
ncbi:MAG TPA: NAD(P)-dependent alcohol dehydrogenase [Ktedonobacterales bacterium]|nr:NAD(P)-dependent alcohol dehydrogenase [Ktedonobacterales bacterium]